MAIDWDDKAERRERINALREEAQTLKTRSAQACRRARELVAESRELLFREDRRRQREALLKRATEALNLAKADTVVCRFPLHHSRKRTG